MSSNIFSCSPCFVINIFPVIMSQFSSYYFDQFVTFWVFMSEFGTLIRSVESCFKNSSKDSRNL